MNVIWLAQCLACMYLARVIMIRVGTERLGTDMNGEAFLIFISRP